jgi:hypothetical protein
MTGPQKLASGEIWFKAQRAIRTVAQVIVTGAGILAVAVVVAPEILDALADVLPGPVVAWAAGVIAAAAALSAALSRVMAIPAVDAWLKRLGLGSAPRSAPVAPPAGPLPSTVAAVDTASRTREL